MRFPEVLAGRLVQEEATKTVITLIAGQGNRDSGRRPLKDGLTTVVHPQSSSKIAG
jgi:hypothetical protein